MTAGAAFILALARLVAPAAVGEENGPAGDPPHGWSLVWSDEFETPGMPDETRWAWDVGGHGWGNRELQFYTDRRHENARVENGLLVIEARREAWEGMDYTSARLVTKGRQAWQEGRFEIRARLPEGRGTWPAIWMLPVDWNLGSGKWPDVGEIDIMEHVGHEPGIIHASAHSRDYQWQAGTQKTATLEVADAARAFHTYTLEWTPLYYKFFVDGQQTWTYNAHVSQRSEYIILSSEVRNHAPGVWAGPLKAGGFGSLAQSRTLMKVDYVKVYQLQ